MEKKPGSSIKRGVSLYSFQEEYFLRKMTLEDCIAASAKMGALGIESIGEQMMPGFPDLSEAFYDRWHGWMAQYGTTPTCHDMFLDTKKYKGRLMTEEEMLQSVIRDLKHANKLGCTVMRCIVNTPPGIMAKAAPYAEQYNVRMGIEIHAPFNFDHEWIQRHLETDAKVGSPYLGILPDMGILKNASRACAAIAISARGRTPTLSNTSAKYMPAMKAQAAWSRRSRRWVPMSLTWRWRMISST